MEEIVLRDYQKEAVKAFETNNSKGLLEMATGTGKTITALVCIDRYYRRNKRQFLVILVPFLHLIDQWKDDFCLIDLSNYIIVAGSKQKWFSKLKSQIWEFNMGLRDRVVVIGSYKSVGSHDFQNLIINVRGNRMLVADECHYLGSPLHKKSNFSYFESRLGLSATPRRWWDEVGTKRVYDIFEKTVFEYNMEVAIENDYLTSYNYYPKVVSLTDEEIDLYELYTSKIGKLVAAMKDNNTGENRDRLTRLLVKRAGILQGAVNKLPLLLELLEKQEDKRYTLVYCAPGDINKVVKSISDLGIKVHRFNSEITKRSDRTKILSLFAAGKIELLVAIKCLDEGVDVPSTRTAYFLSSTSNPREFVQRRGRVLRKSPGKTKSYLYDFIVLQDNSSYEIFDSIAKREMPRYAEFSSLAFNKYGADEREKIKRLLSKYGLEMYLNIKPWDMYELLQHENGGYNETTIGYY